MPGCAIITCKNKSTYVNLKTGGVSYHIFPANPELKEKWISVTGRSNWFPTKLSTVCSKHFTGDDFLVTPHKRHLKPSALPHVDVCILSSFDTQLTKSPPKRKHDEDLNKTTKRVRLNQQAFFACDHVLHNESFVQKRKSHVIEATKITTKITGQENGVLCATNSDDIIYNNTQFYVKPIEIDNDLGSLSLLKRKLQEVEDTNITTKRIRQEDQEFSATDSDRVVLNDSPVHMKNISPPYSNASTPRKRKLNNIIKNHKHVIAKQRSQIRKLQAQNRRLKKKICKIEDVLNDCQNKLLLKNEEISALKNNLQVKELIARYNDKSDNGKTTSRYPPALRTFALTLHYYSPKAYQYVRQTFDTCLPHPSTLRQWYSSVNGDPGFTSESFTALKLKAETTKHQIVAALAIDEMAIKRRVEWDGNKMHGCVDFGCPTDNDAAAEAKEALVFLITAINANFKVPVGYFLVDGVTGVQRSHLVKQCLERVHETGIKIVSLTFDGCASNIAMVNQLGCSLRNGDIQFEHPVTKENVVAIPDPSHMVKLIRNTFQMYKIFVDEKDNLIKWLHLEELNKLQEKENFHLANKLRQQHISFANQKMKVKLATQMFSSSVAEALTFCEDKLKLPAFNGSASTVLFIKTINNLFDIFNSRSTHQHGFKKALNEKNADYIMSYLDTAIKYLSSLKNQDGRLLIETPRKTGFLGFIACARSIRLLYRSLITEKVLMYLPYYKLSQDHLELLFCNLRSHGGFNNNPTARQFKAAYKKILVHVELKSFSEGNCVALEYLTILNCSSPVERINSTIKTIGLSDEMMNTKNTTEEDEEEEALSLFFENLTEFSSQIITYISGNVVKVLGNKIACQDCVGALQSEPDSQQHAFIATRDKGGLIYPSNDVVTICKVAESVVRTFVDNTLKITKDIMVAKIMRNLVDYHLFRDIVNHEMGTYPTATHIIDLQKCVIEKNINIRLHYILKTKKSNLTKRQLFNKYILFNGQ